MLTYAMVWGTIPENQKQWIYLYIGKYIDGEYDGELRRLIERCLIPLQLRVFHRLCYEVGKLYILKGEIK